MNASNAAATTPAKGKAAPTTTTTTTTTMNTSTTAAASSSPNPSGSTTTPVTTTPAATTTTSSWARPYVSTKKSATPTTAPEEEDTRTLVTMRDAMFVIEKERGHGGGRGAVRGCAKKKTTVSQVYVNVHRSLTFLAAFNIVIPTIYLCESVNEPFDHHISGALYVMDSADSLNVGIADGNEKEVISSLTDDSALLTKKDDRGMICSDTTESPDEDEEEDEEDEGGGEEAEEDDEEEEEEDDDNDGDDDSDDDEPSLKYERILGAVPDLLKKDSASALVVANKLMALGTHAGIVHILDLTGKRIKSYKPHMASVIDISMDATADFVATASMD
ncbi:hypothetical protein E4T56_gene7398, partial [Termitomyces sp. T112]